MQFLDAPARVAFKQAIEAVETASSVEVVIAVRKRSARYLHANAIVGAAVAFAALATVLYASHPFAPMSILVDPFVLGLAASAAVELVPAVKRALSPGRAAAVTRAARATFVDRNIHTTTGRTGLLVYVSWLEQRVALVADIGLLRALPDGALARAEAELTDAVPGGGAEVARRLEGARGADGTRAPSPRRRRQRAARRDRRMRRGWPLLILLVPAVALARPGGGDTFSGGGGHGGSGGDSGGSGVFELVYYLLRLCVEVPQVGIPLIAIVVGYLLYAAYRNAKNRDWDSGPPVQLEKAIEATKLRRVDPAFSQIVFEDFAFRLFSTAHRARPDKLATVAPYVSADARTALATRAPTGEPIAQVVVGAMRLYRIDTDGPRVRIGVEFEANLATAAHTYYAVESWLFGRDAGVASKPPSAKIFPCPNCGAPWQAASSGTQVCASCNQVVDNGRFDWVVDEIEVSSIDERSPSLTTEVEERGTDLPTYRQDGADAIWQSLHTDDAAVTWTALQARLGMIYEQLNAAWTKGELPPVRGLVSDGLYDYLSYWVDAYRAQGLRNELVDMRITHAEIARVVRDRYFDAVTIRVWGKGKDYVVRTPTGALVRGSKHRERAYSEYWTLIRAASRRGAPRAEAACGNCGAPLEISMAGACAHCGVHVTAGEFDWVLSKIEQDDTYRG